MIECPYCRSALTETAPSCPNCNLDLSRLKILMGPTPRLSLRGVTDFADFLPNSNLKRLERAVASFHDRFPQSRLAIVFKTFAGDFPLGTQLFWLFNTSGLASEDDKGGRNRDVLIGVDPGRQIAGLTVGYGLEPFLGQEALDHIMRLAVPKLQSGDCSAGVLEILEGLTRLMEGVCRELRDMLGLEDEFAVQEGAGEY